MEHARGALGAADAPSAAARELAAWIAAYRLVRAIAGMAVDPAVAVVRTDPLGVTRHSGPDSPPPADTLDAALLTADALADPVFGPLRPVRVDTHPQLPVGLAEVDGPRAPITAAGTTTDTARLAAVTGRGELPGCILHVLSWRRQWRFARRAAQGCSCWPSG